MHLKVYTLKQALVFVLLFALLVGGCAILLDRLVLGAREQDARAVMAFSADTAEQTPAPDPDNVFTITFEGTHDGEQAQSPEPMPSHTLAPAPSQSPEPALSSELKIEVVKKGQTAQKGGKILIYHTHTYEAYESSEAFSYTSSSKWRTSDPNYNVVRVGEELTRLLTLLGYEVTHDVEAYEPPVLSTSYTRSLQMLEKRAAAGEVYDLYIDLHRDAYNESMKNNNSVLIGGTSVAKLMMLIGKGTGQTGAGFAQKPEWEKNYAIAQALTEDLNAQFDGLARRISVKTGRFNQHIAPRCVLIEVGNNKNTLDEALASIPYLADAIDNVLDNLAQEAL